MKPIAVLAIAATIAAPVQAQVAPAFGRAPIAPSSAPPAAAPDPSDQHFHVVCSDVGTVRFSDYFMFDCITDGKHMVIGLMLKIDETGSGSDLIATNADVARIAGVSAIVTSFIQLRAAGMKVTLSVTGANSKVGGHSPKAETVSLDH